MRQSQLSGDKSLQKDAKEMKMMEYEAIKRADSVIIHSTFELDLLRQDFPSKLLNVFSLVTSIRRPKNRFSDRKNIIFIGGYQHTPNVDAVKYFVAEIMPILRNKLPGVCFYAVGSNPPEEMLRLNCKDVVITGYVEDIASLLETMRVSVAPLRYGAGIKGKIGTAMAAGVPTVATSLAVEGMSLDSGEHILVADDPIDFADQLEALYFNEILWEKISSNSMSFATKNWGPEVACKTLVNILRGIGIFAECKRVGAINLYSN
jgi:glycosyltransferase involved in cell wall biosynthesis